MLLSDDYVQLVPLEETYVEFLTWIRTDWANYDFFFDFHLATREQELTWIARVTHDPSQVNFVILSKGSDSQPAGTISLTSIDVRSRHAEYGRLFVAPQHRGSGVARRASRLLLDYAFRELNLQKIYLRVFADNEPAIRLYTHLGFEAEGCLRSHVYKDGVYRDVRLMAVFAPQSGGG